MLSDFNIRAVTLLLIGSISVMLFHAFGGMQISLPLLSASENAGFSEISSDNVTYNLALEDNIPTANCHLTDTSGYNICGISVSLGDSEKIGEDLSLYNSIELNIAIHSPNKDARIRFSFRNFNPNYSIANDHISLKFNTIKYIPKPENSQIIVPLSAFQVEFWWLEQYSVGLDNAQLDLSNVVYVEVVTDEMGVPGNYEIALHQATLLGELISEQDLLKLILLVWLMVIILLISLQRNNLKIASTTDLQTGLINRRGLEQWINNNLQKSKTDSPLTMFYFDIDDFKKINDSFGHLVGDELLLVFSAKVSQTLQSLEFPLPKHVFSRLSGDEFALVFKGLESPQIELIGKAIFHTLRERVSLSNNEVSISISLGIASSEQDVSSFSSLLSNADSAMYYAKKKGKNRFKIFDKTVSKETLFRKKVAGNLRLALKKDQFTLKLMPIYQASDLSIHGVEVLLRTDAVSLMGIGPDVFIPIAEEYNIIKDIDLWVVEATLKLMAENRDFIKLNPFVFGINISSVELHNSHFPIEVSKLLLKYEIPAQWLEMEITETSLIEADDLSIAVLNDIRDLGIKLSLDDFGTGYTAFNQLMRYPVDYLKIDKSFVDDLTSKSKSKKTMIKAILSIAKAYHLLTIAEGIENITQYKYVTERGCDMVQGYFFSKPIDWESLVLLLAEPKENRMAKIQTH